MALEAKNATAMRKWIRTHRPDALGTFEGIMAGEERGDERMRAVFALMAIGFAAGREYQREHPKDKET